MPEGGPRYQLVEGELIEMSPAPNSRHQRVCRGIFVPLHLHVQSQRLGEVLYAPIDVYLSDDTVLQPDVVLVASKSAARVEADGIHGPPDLVVEVLSPSTRRLDLGRKDAIYAARGVREAWFVDLEIDEVRIHRYSAGASATPLLLGRAATIETPLLPGFALNVAEALGTEEA
jgi:Uma2 family endonuclease